MNRGLINPELLVETAEAIRTKKGVSYSISPRDFSSEISSIATGSSSSEKPEWVSNYTDGKTRFYITVFDEEHKEFILNFDSSDLGIINWGDGTSEEVSSGNHLLSHTYAACGDYVITIGSSEEDYDLDFVVTFREMLNESDKTALLEFLGESSDIGEASSRLTWLMAFNKEEIPGLLWPIMMLREVDFGNIQCIQSFMAFSFYINLTYIRFQRKPESAAGEEDYPIEIRSRLDFCNCWSLRTLPSISVFYTESVSDRAFQNCQSLNELAWKSRAGNLAYRYFFRGSGVQKITFLNDDSDDIDIGFSDYQRWPDLLKEMHFRNYGIVWAYGNEAYEYLPISCIFYFPRSLKERIIEEDWYSWLPHRIRFE